MSVRDKNLDVRISEYCEKHDTNKIVSWCSNHETGVCMACQSVDHSDCQELEPLDRFVTAPELLAEFKTLKRKNARIRTVYKTLEHERESNIESLKIQKSEIRTQIRNLRENLTSYLVELEQDMTEELEEACTHYTKKLEQEIKDYKYRNALLERFEEDSSRAMESGTNLQIMIAAKQETAMTNKEEQNVQNINGAIKNYSVELKIRDVINDILNITSMGNIDRIEADAFVDTELLSPRPILPDIKRRKTQSSVENKNQLRWDRTRFKSEKEFDMNASLDKYLPDITGAVFLPDESFILADAAYQRLLHFKRPGEIFHEIPLSFVPFDVGLLGKSRLYISVAKSRRLEIRDVGSMKEVDEIILPGTISGINGYNDSLLVVACERNGLVLFGKNNNISVIPIRQSEDGPLDVSADRVCFAESKKCLVYSFTHDGKKIFIKSVEGLGYIHGIAFLKDNSVLVAKLSPGRHSVYHISQDGKEKMLRLEMNDIASPKVFAVHRKTRMFLLVHGIRKISIFKEL